MEKKIKFIVVGLLGLVLIFIFLYVQTLNSKQQAIKERDALKNENISLNEKVERFAGELRENKKENDSLKGELEKNTKDLIDLQRKYDDTARAKEELEEKLKSTPRSAPQQQPRSDAYWAEILKAKTGLEMQLESIRTELRSTLISNEQLQREKAALGLDIEGLKREAGDLKRQIEYNQKLMDSIAQELVRERSDKLKIQEGFQPLKSENTSLSRQLKGLYGKKISLDKKISQIQDEKNALSRKVSEMDTMLIDKISQINTLKEQLENIRRIPDSPEGAVAVTPQKKDTVELPPIIVRAKEDLPAPGKDNDLPEIGSILTVNRDSNFVIIDSGEDAGVKVGDTFKVWRAGENIATITVIKASRSVAACDIKQEIKPLKIGDKIR